MTAINQTQTAPKADKNLAQGGPLTPANFTDFIARLKNDIDGPRCNDHCTADAIFIVERAVITTGIDLEFSPPKLITDDEQERYWFSPLEYWGSLSSEEQASVNEDSIEREKKPFLSLTEDEQWGFIERSDYPYVYGYHKYWDFLNAHLTYDAAESYITQHGHKHEGELRINVESRYRTPEITTIINALVAGQLVLKGPAQADDAPQLAGVDFAKTDKPEQNKPTFHVNQIKLISAISRELSRQHPGLCVHHEQFNEIIKAANIVCAAYKAESNE